jgi:hypothetical protein
MNEITLLLAQADSTLIPRIIGIACGIPAGIIATAAFYQKRAAWVILLFVVAILTAIVGTIVNGEFNPGIIATILLFSLVGGALGYAKNKSSNDNPS